MKNKYILIASYFFTVFIFPLSAYDSKDLDFSIAPKTTFTVQSNSTLLKTGLVPQSEKSSQNKKDVALPDKKLLRGFERFPKTDAFGDTLPDSFLFYRQNLSSNQKSAYDEIFKAVMNAEQNLTIITRISSKEIGAVCEAVYYDNPELFWWDGTFSWYYNANGTVTAINFLYLFSSSDLKQCNKEFLNMSLPIIFYANLLENDMDKIKYVHDYLCLSVDYDYESYKAGNCGGKLQTAYSAVVEYKTVCAGYSRAFAYYMQQLHIPCTVLYGSDHAWNMIKVGDESYQVDVTWDDGNKIPPYFNLPHSAMQKVESHSLSENSLKVVQKNPTTSGTKTYSAYFGQIPIGIPYTYQEFSNIREDIENPAYAEVQVRKNL